MHAKAVERGASLKPPMGVQAERGVCVVCEVIGTIWFIVLYQRVSADVYPFLCINSYVNRKS